MSDCKICLHAVNLIFDGEVWSALETFDFTLHIPLGFALGRLEGGTIDRKLALLLDIDFLITLLIAHRCTYSGEDRPPEKSQEHVTYKSVRYGVLVVERAVAGQRLYYTPKRRCSLLKVSGSSFKRCSFERLGALKFRAVARSYRRAVFIGGRPSADRPRGLLRNRLSPKAESFAKGKMLSRDHPVEVAGGTSCDAGTDRLTSLRMGRSAKQGPSSWKSLTDKLRSRGHD